MTPTQQSYIDNLTATQARRLVAKFNDDPAVAADKSEAAYLAFCRAWEITYPGEYIIRRNLAGGVSFTLHNGAYRPVGE